MTILGRDLACAQIFPYSQAFQFCRGWKDTEQLFQDADRLQGDVPRLVVFYLENEEVLSTYYRDLTLERQKRENETWKFSSYGEYLADLDQQKLDLEVIPGDLNPEFTGTFALRTPIKLWNRKAETALLEAEEWNALLKLGLETKLEEWWWEMSYAQFHDVFTGSHEDITYLDLIKRLQTVAAGARSSVEDTFSLPGNTSSAVCLNALPYPRKEWVELPGGEGRKVAVRQGDRDLPVEYEGDRAFCQVDVPPVSATNLSVQLGEPRPIPAVDLGQPCESCVLENGRITLSLHRKKGIVSLAAPELLMAQVKDFLVVQEDKGSLQIEDVLGEELSVMDGSAQLYYRENAMGQYGLYRGEFQGMHWNRGENRLQWSVEFCLPKEEAGISVKIWVDWKGEATRIRFRVPHLVDSSLGIYEIPFGTVGRSTYDGHATAKGEWPAHRFVAIEDQKKGLALVNRGVAGVELAGNAFETTLLRAYPDQPGVWVPVTLLSSQHGQHQYEFLLVPYHPGAVDQVAQTAQRWNQPITVLPGSCGESWAGESFLDIGPSNLVLSSVKTADDGSGDMILRYYETCGRNTEGQVFVRGGKEIWLSDVTEKSVTRLAQGETTAIRCRPYEIQTLRVKR